MPAQPQRHPLPDAVCCHLCVPPQRVEIPAGVFYRLRDADLIACANGHQGTLSEYKRAAARVGTPHGPFIRYHPHHADWLPAAVED